jgi:hypothetical protein
LTKSELQIALGLVSQLHEQVDRELDEAVNLMSGNLFRDEWWANRIAANLESSEGPATSFKDIEGNRSAVIVEMAFWAGWLKGEFDTLGMLNKTLKVMGEVLNKQTPYQGE